MANIPRDKSIDLSIPLLQKGYPYLQQKFEELKTEIFSARLMGEKTICIHGEEAAKIFYDQEKFKRKGAVPKRIQKSLFGTKGVQLLDNAAHRHRKGMFMSVMGRDSVKKLMDLTAKQWEIYIAKWKKSDQLHVLFEEAQEIQCRAGCAWAGIPLKEEEVRQRTEDFMGMIDSFGAFGPRHMRGRLAMFRSQKWLRSIVEQVRSGKLEAEEGTVIREFANHKDLNGQLLDTKIVAEDLANAVRPFVAVAYFITFAALALHDHPEYRQKLRQGDEQDIEMFVQEVRRYYPFVPLLGARVRNEFDWKNHHFKKNRLVLLDVYGLLHDSRQWEVPGEFRPERFLDWNGSPFNFIPQGGGDFYEGHRCAGEWITIGATKVGLEFLIQLAYEVPEQDLGFSLSRIPTYPKSGFAIRNVRRLA